MLTELDLTVIHVEVDSLFRCCKLKSLMCLKLKFELLFKSSFKISFETKHLALNGCFFLFYVLLKMSISFLQRNPCKNRRILMKMQCFCRISTWKEIHC